MGPIEYVARTKEQVCLFVRLFGWLAIQVTYINSLSRNPSRLV